MKEKEKQVLREKRQEDEKFFKELFNPTLEELKEWSYTHDYIPCQDWQLAVTPQPIVALKLAEDPKSLLQNFFLDSLYVFVGDIIRRDYAYMGDRELLENFLTEAKKSKDSRIKKLIERSEYLIKHPETYTYENWGLCNNFARNPLT